MRNLLLLVVALAASTPLALSAQTRDLLGVEYVDYPIAPLINVQLREGVSYETGPLKACVLYLEGLGDSIMNHRPLFSNLNQNGYRVIAFDYMGQGGSQGSMNLT